MIKNDARVNEDVDSGVLIRKLRSDCAALSNEVAFLKVRLWCDLHRQGFRSSLPRMKCDRLIGIPSVLARGIVGVHEDRQREKR